MQTLSDFHATSIEGTDVPLSDYVGKVVLVVNTASQCGLTPQYQGLEALHEKYADSGLAILGFPCDQFGHQEPGTDDEIAQFCEASFGVQFPMFSKIEVNGDQAHPLYAWLRSERVGADGDAIEWNFAKFLLNKKGEVIERYSPKTVPEALTTDIEAALAS